MSNAQKIYYTKPSITGLEIQYATDAAANGWGDSCYEYITRFETTFKQHLGVKHAVATSSCTGALHMGLAALEIKPGDEVILADINWVATAAPITYLGAKPVFVDILPDTWCIDPELAEKAVTPKTKAIIATHLYGNLCEMNELLAIGERHGLPIIEDAAEAIGSVYHGRRAGSMGLFGTFSFHGTKTITTGEGGMFVTDDDALFERVLTLSNHGRRQTQAKQFWPDMIGFKYKMSNIQAAIGCAQMERVDELIAGRRRIFDYYARHLSYLPLQMNFERKETTIGCWMPTVVFDKSLSFRRDKLLAALNKENIDGRVFFWPLSILTMFKQNSQSKVCYDLYKNAINLPSYHDLTYIEQDRVIQVIVTFLKNCYK